MTKSLSALVKFDEIGGKLPLRAEALAMLMDGIVADWLRPIYEEIRTGVMTGGYLQLDETSICRLSSRPRLSSQNSEWPMRLRTSKARRGVAGA